MKRLEKGQTLIIALIIMGALLTIGLTLSGIIGSHLHNTIQAKKKTLVEQLAESGIQYLHQELLKNGADWQPLESQLSDKDPDYFFLQPGGPDDKGSYSKISLEKGRALIRVRWVDKDEQQAQQQNVEGYATRMDFSRYPGCLVLESIGRSGKIDLKDPTTLAKKPVSKEDFYHQESKTKIETVKRIALVPLLILENLFAITNKDRHTRYCEIGYPKNWDYNWEWTNDARSWSNANLEIKETNNKAIEINTPHGAISIQNNKYGTRAKRLEPPILLNTVSNALEISGSQIGAIKGDQNIFSSLIQDWINPHHPESEGWIGSYYIPKCVRLVFDKRGFTLYRGLQDNQNVLTYERYFISQDNEKFYYQKEGDNQKREFCGVIFVDGDVGVKGVHPSKTALTVKSKGTIYIEGPLVKSKKSKMVLLASHYICVNPTLFFQPKNNLFSMKKAQLGEDTVFELDRPEDDLFFNVFIDKNNQDKNPYFILLYKRRPEVDVRPESPEGLSNPEITDYKGEIFELKQLDIFKNQKPDDLSRFVDIRVRNRFFSFDGKPLGKKENFHFIRAAVFPYHVQIQAAAYAETGSFFVIPGPKFYPDSDNPLDITFEWEGSLAQNLTARWDQQELWLHRWGQPRQNKNRQQMLGWNWKYDPDLVKSTRQNHVTKCILPPFAGLSVSASKLYYGEDR